MQVENKMLVDSFWQHIEAPAGGIENMVQQQEHWGTDHYDFEILEGDEIVIDKENFDEIILKDNLKRYLEEQVNFKFFTIQGVAVAVDLEKEMAVAEDGLEKYLHDVHGFYFTQAN